MPMTEIQELLTKIKADIRDYESKMSKSRKEAKNTAKSIKKSSGGMGAAFKGVTKGIGFFHAAIAAAGVAVAVNFVKNTIEGADAIAKLASNIGISTDLLQELQFAAQQTGVSQNDLNSSMLRFNRRLAEAAAGSGEFAKAYQQLGINVTNADGSMRSAEDVLFDVADNVSKMGSEAEQASVLFKIFGDSGFKMVNLFKDGSPAIRQFQQEARNLGIVIGADTLKRSEELNEQLGVLSKVVKAQLTEAVLALAPVITAIVDKFRDWAMTAKIVIDGFKKLIGQTDKHEKETKKDTAAIARASAAMKKHAKFVEDVTKIVKKANEENDVGKRLEQEIALLQKAAEQKLEIEGELQEALMEKQEEFREWKDEQRQAEIEDLLERNELLMQMGDDLNQYQIDRNQKKIDRLMAQEDRGSKFALKMYARQKKAYDEMLAAQLGAASTFFGNMMTLTKGRSRALFQVSRALAVATAVIEGIVATQRAFANPPGPPFSAIQAAAAATSAAVRVSAIAGTRFQARTGMDSVPGIGRGDKIPVMTEPNERIFSVDQNKTFTSFMEKMMKGMAPAAPQGGTLEIVFRDGAERFIEARLISRNRLNTAQGALA